MSRTDTGTPNDKVRQAVLDHLYSIYKKSSLKGNRTKISEIKTALKKGFKESEIAAALYYLIKTEFAEEVKERYPISRGGKIIRAESISYRISDTNINHFEGSSEFQKSHKFAGINVTNIKGITQIGEGNMVQEFSKTCSVSLASSAMR